MTPPLRHTPDAVYRDLAEGRGGVLLHLESADYVQLNDVAARVWNAIDGTRDEEGVVAALRAQLPDAPAAMEDDVRRFIATLRERGLVT
ncbi:MAG: PqqD family protein [Frankiaceae bacterium]